MAPIVYGWPQLLSYLALIQCLRDERGPFTTTNDAQLIAPSLARHLRHPRVAAHLIDIEALLRVPLQHLFQQVDDEGAHALPLRTLKRDLQLHQLVHAAALVALGLKGQVRAEEDVEDDSEAVHVRLEVAGHLEDDLGRHEAYCACLLHDRLARRQLHSEAQIAYFDAGHVGIIAEEDVEELEVAVHQSQVVHVLEAERQLIKDVLGLGLGEPVELALSKTLLFASEAVLEQVATRCELRY